MKTTVEIRSKQKIKFYEEAMKEDHVLLHLDARKPGVTVPSHLAQNYSLTLKLSYLFQGKTEHNDDEVSSYLKFGNDYFHCIIPWKAVWGITPNKKQNRIWPEDLPKELIIEFTKAKFKELGTKLFGNNETNSPEQANEQTETTPPASEKPNINPEDRRKLLKLIK